MKMRSQFVEITSGSFFDDLVFVLLSLATGLNYISMTSLLLELWHFLFTRDSPEIQKYTPVWTFPNLWRLMRVRDTKFSAIITDKVLRNSEKCQDCSFYHFWVIKGKPAGRLRNLYPLLYIPAVFKSLFLALLDRTCISCYTFSKRLKFSKLRKLRWKIWMRKNTGNLKMKNSEAFNDLLSCNYTHILKKWLQAVE